MTGGRFFAKISIPMASITVERGSVAERLAGVFRAIGLKRPVEQLKPHRPISETRVLQVHAAELKYMPTLSAQKDIFVSTVLKLRKEGALYDPNNPD